MVEIGEASVQAVTSEPSPPFPAAPTSTLPASAAEPVLQRQAAAPLAEAHPAAQSHPEVPPPPHSPADLDALSRELYDRLRVRLRFELLIDRERAGLVTDLR